MGQRHGHAGHCEGGAKVEGNGLLRRDRRTVGSGRPGGKVDQKELAVLTDDPRMMRRHGCRQHHVVVGRATDRDLVLAERRGHRGGILGASP